MWSDSDVGHFGEIVSFRRTVKTIVLGGAPNFGSVVEIVGIGFPASVRDQSGPISAALPDARLRSPESPLQLLCRV